MKLKINELEINNIKETSTQNRINIEQTLSNFVDTYNALSDLKSFSLTFIEDQEEIGLYTNKRLVKMEYNNGIISLILTDVDPLFLQVQELQEKVAELSKQ